MIPSWTLSWRRALVLLLCVAGETGAGSGTAWHILMVLIHWGVYVSGPKRSGLSLLSPSTPVKAKGVFYCCSSVCADIHCAGSEWLWWDVHDLHIAYGKWRVITWLYFIFLLWLWAGLAGKNKVDLLPVAWIACFLFGTKGQLPFYLKGWILGGYSKAFFHPSRLGFFGGGFVLFCFVLPAPCISVEGGGKKRNRFCLGLKLSYTCTCSAKLPGTGWMCLHSV